MAAITYQQAVDQMNSALDALKKARQARAMNAHDVQLQRESIASLEKSFQYWEGRVNELNPATSSTIEIAQMVPR